MSAVIHAIAPRFNETSSANDLGREVSCIPHGRGALPCLKGEMAGGFLGGLKSAGVESFAGETDDGGALALRFSVHPQAGEVTGVRQGT